MYNWSNRTINFVFPSLSSHWKKHKGLYFLIFVNWLVLVVFASETKDNVSALTRSSPLFMNVFYITLLSVILLFILGRYGPKITQRMFRKKSIGSFKKYIVVVLVLSSYFYVTSIYTMASHTANEHRRSLNNKIKLHKLGYIQGGNGQDLNHAEYKILSDAWFESIHPISTDIEFAYTHEVMGDYNLSVSYTLPDSVDIEPIKEEDDQFYVNQTIEILKEGKRVSYEEGLY
ncbi:MAG: hypothetical protein ACI9UJ_002196 [bacterium]|jgi:hypothetical protein